ncbi:MAG: preprotein translocase subunit YajC [Chloroflexi bacterium]|nr:preprotein translocase subunit YajC [Chloroflexota bacterium]
MGNSIKVKIGAIVGLVGGLGFIGGCLPAREPTEGFDWSIIIFLVFIFVVFYFLLIRPQRKRQKEHLEMVQEMRKGDNVITAGGIYGVVESIREDSVVIKVESGTTMRVAKGSVVARQQK